MCFNFDDYIRLKKLCRGLGRLFKMKRFLHKHGGGAKLGAPGPTQSQGTPVIPALGDGKQVDTWSLLAGQSSRNSYLQANEKPCLKRQGGERHVTLPQHAHPTLMHPYTYCTHTGINRWTDSPSKNRKLSPRRSQASQAAYKKCSWAGQLKKTAGWELPSKAKPEKPGQHAGKRVSQANRQRVIENRLRTWKGSPH